jgi:hypothetical protein
MAVKKFYITIVDNNKKFIGFYSSDCYKDLRKNAETQGFITYGSIIKS